MLDGTVYHINMDDMVVEELVKGLGNDGFAASESNRFAAWVSSGTAKKAAWISAVILLVFSQPGKQLEKGHSGIMIIIICPFRINARDPVPVFLYEVFECIIVQSHSRKHSFSSPAKLPL